MLNSQRVAQHEEEDQKNVKLETFDLSRAPANEDTFDPRRTQAAAANDPVNFGRQQTLPI